MGLVAGVKGQEADNKYTRHSKQSDEQEEGVEGHLSTPRAGALVNRFTYPARLCGLLSLF